MKGPFHILFAWLLFGLALSAFFLPEKNAAKLNPDQFSEEEMEIPFLPEQEEWKAPEGFQIAWTINGQRWYSAPLLKPSAVLAPEGLLSISSVSTSFRWKAPLPGQPRISAFRYFIYSAGDKTRSSIQYYSSGNSSTSLPVLSLFVDADDFFSAKRGIYVPGQASYSGAGAFHTPWWERPANYLNRGKAWERKVHFQWFDTTGKLCYESDASAQIHGNATRAYPQKSIRLTAEKEFGNGSFKYDFFESRSKHGYDHLVLRNGGNDWDRTLIADGYIHRYLSSWPSLNDTLAHQEYRPCIVFINGEYWGIHSLRDRMNEDLLARQFSVKKDKVALFEGKIQVAGNSNDQNDYDALMRWCREKDLSADSNFHWVEQRVNVNDLIAYLSVEFFCANSDWPANNVKMYRIDSKDVPENKRKWNWALWDMDYSFSYVGPQAVNTNMIRRLRESKTDLAVLFNALLKNRQFRSRFIMHASMDVASFSAEALNNALAAESMKIRSEMPSQIARWRKPSSMEQWETSVQEIREFISARHDVVRQQLMELEQEFGKEMLP